MLRKAAINKNVLLLLLLSTIMITIIIILTFTIKYDNETITTFRTGADWIHIGSRGPYLMTHKNRHQHEFLQPVWGGPVFSQTGEAFIRFAPVLSIAMRFFLALSLPLSPRAVSGCALM